MRVFVGMLSCMILLFLTACAENPSAKSEPDYDQTKKMVVDILHTDEGRDALLDTLQEEEMKQQLIMDSDDVKASINEALVSDKGKEMWQKLFDDSSFAESYINATKDGQEKMFKHLMSDADFQKKMLTLLQDPEMTKQTLTLLKSQAFREYLEETIEETIESPVFQEKMKQTLLKAAEKEGEDEEKGSDEASDNQQEQDNEDDDEE